jgi:hypothetical protein
VCFLLWHNGRVVFDNSASECPENAIGYSMNLSQQAKTVKAGSPQSTWLIIDIAKSLDT